jgi:hypothetical protein
MRKEKKGGFINLFANNEPEMVDRYGNKINYVAPSSVGNVNNLSGFNGMVNNNVNNNSTIDSKPYYDTYPYNQVLARIRKKDVGYYQSLRCEKERVNEEIISHELTRLELENKKSPATEMLNRERTSSVENKLKNAKNKRANCFNNSKRKLLEIKNNMGLNMSTTGGKKKTYKRNKKSKKTRKNKRSK